MVGLQSNSRLMKFLFDSVCFLKDFCNAELHLKRSMIRFDSDIVLNAGVAEQAQITEQVQQMVELM